MIDSGEIRAVKFGVSYDPFRRLLDLQTSQPFDLSILATVTANRWYRDIERIIHELLDRERMEGEWFVCNSRTGSIVELMRFLSDQEAEAGAELPDWIIRCRSYMANKYMREYRKKRNES